MTCKLNFKQLRKLLPLLLIALLIIPACGKKKTKLKVTKIKFDGLKERTIRFSPIAKIEGFISGYSSEKNEVYIHALSSRLGKHSMLIVDTLTGKVKKEIKLSRGTHQSPTDFFNPSFMQYLDGRYYIIDQYSKILVYDDRMHYLATHMFEMHRYFIDFYKKDNLIHFVIGEKHYGMEYKYNRVRLYHLPENRRPVVLKKLALFQNPAFGKKRKQERSKMFRGPLWTSGKGFQKDGRIYVTNNENNTYLSYNLEKEKQEVFGLLYLKPKTYSDETIKKFAFARSSGWEKELFKKRGTRVVAVNYPRPLFQFGLYDVGKSKIGVIADVDTEKFEFRLDVIDIVKGEYIESYRFPFGVYLKENLSTSARGFSPTFIDVDKGIYLWCNQEGEDFIDYVRIDSFKVMPTKIEKK